MKNLNKKSLLNKRAFTLIELLIVIAIIGILFIVLVSKVDFATDKAKASGVQTDFRSFQMAFDTVAKENAGFNTFGWDTGDVNQDGIRNSYDEGDNGAGGGTAKNGIQDGDEVFTGHKVYDETFTKIFSLKKNGTGDYDRDALNRLETAINANLDPKLHITIGTDGKITMANGAQDPWNKEYHGYYITNAETDGQDRGAIVLYSDGANNTFGSEHTIANGAVNITVPGSNKDGKDDMSITSCYTYINGYGEVKNMTTGFSNNQSFLAGNNSVNNDVVIDEKVHGKVPGLYRPDGSFVSWDELIANNIIAVDDGKLYGVCENNPWDYNNYSQSYLEGELVVSGKAGVVCIPQFGFFGFSKLTGIVLPDTVTTLETLSFMDCSSISSAVLSGNITSIDSFAFYTTNLKTLVFNGTMAQWNSMERHEDWCGNPVVDRAYVVENIKCLNGTIANN